MDLCKSDFSNPEFAKISTILAIILYLCHWQHATRSWAQMYQMPHDSRVYWHRADQPELAYADRMAKRRTAPP